MTAKYAVFIEPENELRDFLVNCKERVQRWRPGQPYADHPPHSTVIFGEYSDPVNWIDEMAQKIRQVPFTIHIDHWKVFENDTMAGGGQTVTLAVNEMPELFALQISCAAILKDHRTTIPNNDTKTNGPLAISQQLYGFPFVGEHWIPHFSVASLVANMSDDFLRSMISQPVSFSQQVNRVSIWRVEGQVHTRISELSLL